MNGKTMRLRNGFYDLSVAAVSKIPLTNILQTLIDLGYRTVAINQIVEEAALEPQEKKGKKRKGEKDVQSPVPPPMNLNDIPEEIKRSIKILHRVTVYFSTSDMAHKMVSSENFNKYDIVAVIPTSKAALQHLCSSLDVDIISLDPSVKMPVRWTRKLYYVAIEKGMWFELPYASAVLDSTARRNLIEAGHLYHAFGKSKNIIVSSGAENPMQIRGPYDVINLCLLLGLSEEQAKSAITNAGQSVVLRAESRRSGKAIVFIERLTSNLCGGEEQDEDQDLQPVPKKLCVAG